MEYNDYIETLAAGVIDDIEKIAAEEDAQNQNDDNDEEDDEMTEREMQEMAVADMVQKAASVLEDAILRKQAAEEVYAEADEDMEIVAAVIAELDGDFEKFAYAVVEEMEK